MTEKTKTVDSASFFYSHCEGCEFLKKHKNQNFFVCSIEEKQHRIKEGRKPAWCKKELK